MSRTALLCDVHNLYINGLKKYPGQILNYSKLVETTTAQGFCLRHKLAYGKQPVDKARQFATLMDRLGFQLYFNNVPHNIHMALQVADLIEHRAIDSLILGTNNFEAIHILEYAHHRGIWCNVIGFDIPEAFGNVALVTELDPSYMQQREATKQLDVPTNSPGDTASGAD